MSTGSDRKPKHHAEAEAKARAREQADRERAQADKQRAHADKRRAHADKRRAHADAANVRREAEQQGARAAAQAEKQSERAARDAAQAAERAHAAMDRAKARVQAVAEKARARLQKLSQGGARDDALETRGRPKDDARTLALLWQAHDRAGRSGLSVRAIVDAAVALADREGLDAVSMRRVADALEVGTMSLYTHVPGKAELMDLMTDAAYGELYDHVEQPSTQPGGYRAGMHFVAERYRQLYEDHPWLLDVPLGRPVLGPNACMKYEAEVRVLDGVGLSDPEIDSMVALLVMHVQSTARVRLAVRRAQQSSGQSEEEWWTTTIPLLLRVRTGHYPVGGRVGAATGQALSGGDSAEHLFRFGLEQLCDAVANMIERHRNK